jgi:signal transduction histidine kinase
MSLQGVVPKRATPRPPGEHTAMPRWVEALLRIPLVAKLAGANAIIVIAAWIAASTTHGDSAHDAELLRILAIAVSGALVANVTLVTLALRPLADLERTASRVWRGDLDARVPPSLLADRDLTRIGATINVLLDGLTADRARMRMLAAEVIRAGDRERAHIARELHDSAAQSIAALNYQLAAAVRDANDPTLSERLAAIREAGAQVLEEVRVLAQTVHPRVLDDLGLAAGLRNLARELQARSKAPIVVDIDPDAANIPAALGTVLYRVAQDALNNAILHAAATRITINLSRQHDRIVLEVADDGRGFDAEEAERRRAGLGLFTMRERVALVDGEFTLHSAPRAGTRVRASLPLGA